MKEKDSNSKFSGTSVNKKGKQNQIVVLKFGDRWDEEVSEVRSEVISYFSSQFSESPSDILGLDGVTFPTLAWDQRSALLSHFF